ncbi:hypothetical protein C1637_18515 [Chryseobacterium lactis]|uniref:Uncharacterized protein n=2 Tax=Chryseobacterium lactis TaxID=1241981 RepID=A0A3G6RJZ9_CHRLC|nr:hypothetical protein EG342_24020 [Chryseobacterium lactis]AZB05165.1 hypothetical protein EG341_14900 [Chryseobacterium lactis]PNW12147.1 hypothetical protein C1637_18515 [Chryseobacterium lactis]
MIFVSIEIGFSPFNQLNKTHLKVEILEMLKNTLLEIMIFVSIEMGFSPFNQYETCLLALAETYIS